MMLLDIDPNVVQPGWTPLIITIGLALVMVLLFFSMRRHFRKINASDAFATPRTVPSESASRSNPTRTAPAPGTLPREQDVDITRASQD